MLEERLARLLQESCRKRTRVSSNRRQPSRNSRSSFIGFEIEEINVESLIDR